MDFGVFTYIWYLKPGAQMKLTREKNVEIKDKRMKDKINWERRQKGSPP